MILLVLAVCNFTILYRLNISCIASYHSNGTQKSSQTLSIPSIEPRTCLEYCNSLLNNIVKQDLSKLQRVHNCLARVVLRAPRFSPSLPLFKQLDWHPVNYRIKFKLSILIHRALAIHQPPYLASLLHFSSIPIQRRSCSLLFPELN